MLGYRKLSSLKGAFVALLLFTTIGCGAKETTSTTPTEFTVQSTTTSDTYDATSNSVGTDKTTFSASIEAIYVQTTYINSDKAKGKTVTTSVYKGGALYQSSSGTMLSGSNVSTTTVAPSIADLLLYGKFGVGQYSYRFIMDDTLYAQDSWEITN